MAASIDKFLAISRTFIKGKQKCPKQESQHRSLLIGLVAP